MEVPNGITPPTSQEIQHTPSTGIAQLLREGLVQRSVPPPPDIRITTGDAAALTTNERYPEGFLESIKKEMPDGYIVGIGCGTSLLLPECFSPNLPPKGMILADINPLVVAVGRTLVKMIAQSSDIDTLRRDFLEDVENGQYMSIRRKLQIDDDPILSARVEGKTRLDWEAAFRKATTRFKKEYEPRQNTTEINIPNIIEGISKNFPLLKQLAEAGNIAFAFNDFTNPDFIESVRSLPDFSNLKNIIYISNIFDHVVFQKRGEDPSQVADEFAHSFKPYEQSKKPPIFIDTLRRLKYDLRVSSGVPISFAA